MDQNYFEIYLGAEAFAVITISEVPSLALSLLDLLDNREEDGVHTVLTVVFGAAAVSIAATDVLTSVGAGPLAAVGTTFSAGILAVPAVANRE